MPEGSRTHSPVLTGARQTMSTWSRVIESVDKAPDAFQGFFKTLPDNGHPFPYSVLAPPFVRFLHRPPEKMICDVDDTWHVLERSGSQFVVKSYPLQSICDIEMGRILLHSWITISGASVDGTATSSTIEFNTATARYYAYFQHQFRSTSEVVEDAALETEQKKFDYMATINYKFMNYARSSLTGREKVLHSVWQPEMRERSLPLFGWLFYRTITTAHLLILTDKEVILVRDDERSHLNRGIRYGGARRFIPLRSILSTSLTEQDNELLTFSLHLCQDRQLEYLFAASLKPELEQFQVELEKIMGPAVSQK